CRSPLLSGGVGGGQAGGEVKKTLLVEFFTTGNSDVTAFLVPLWEDNAPTVVRFSVEQPTLPQMAETLSHASRILRPLTRAQIRGEAAPSPEAERNAKAQFERFPNEMSQLVAPWASYLEAWQPTELIFSPHSWLNLLPLHAAIWNGKPLIEHVPIAYLPSAALAGEFAKRRKPITGNALLIGNPTGDLISAEMEAHKVAELLKTQHIHVKLFLRDEATAQRIIDNVPETGIVHTACHSQLEPHDFLRSGMEMADRRLTALEIMNRIDLSQVALVYLSSCDGAASLPEHTDELMALVRAFLSAGAPTVIASLWPLDDGYACLFAEAFYQSWMQDRQPMPVAFREAMNFVRRMAPNPFYWAPLVLMGAWEAEQSFPAFRELP
ncbi:CHAT domain-containing protein, partial [Candidatus Poribacteria bacterium]|nr:CHAT domain-containing protein [Candidatus Poribacteria bacterium]